MSEVKSLKEIVLQLRACGFTCEAGPLENNTDFRLLAELADVDLPKTLWQCVVEAGKNAHNIGIAMADAFSALGKLPARSQQDIRDEIVEKAKRDIDGLKVTYHPKLKLYCTAEFVVNREKRTVVALMKQLSTYPTSPIVSRGIAKADPSDCFNVHIGKAIALRRALGIEVPAEYLNAPQPTEVRVGDVVEFYNEINVPHIVDNYNCGLVLKPLPNIDISYAERTSHKILDDSREEVAE